MRILKTRAIPRSTTPCLPSVSTTFSPSKSSAKACECSWKPVRSSTSTGGDSCRTAVARASPTEIRESLLPSIDSILQGDSPCSRGRSLDILAISPFESLIFLDLPLKSHLKSSKVLDIGPGLPEPSVPWHRTWSWPRSWGGHAPAAAHTRRPPASPSPSPCRAA